MSGSLLVLRSHFDTEDPEFLTYLATVDAPGELASFAERWARDPRPWAREQFFAYFDQPLRAPGHESLVKRLFKSAEAAADHERVGAAMVAFDRLIRRRRRMGQVWGWNARALVWALLVRSPSNSMPHKAQRERHARYFDEFLASRPDLRLFSYPTRHHLRRRAWRCFRRLAFQNPELYVPAVVPALARYHDDDVGDGSALLDCWGLMHVCFGAHPSLSWTAESMHLAEGASLGEIGASPRFGELWRAPEALDPLLRLLEDARSRLVRVFAMQVLRDGHADAIVARGVDLILSFLQHKDPDVQGFGAELFQASNELGKLPLSAWLRLLEIEDPGALTIVAEQFERHVRPERVDLVTRVDLATRAPATVARLGIDLLSADDAASAPAGRPLLAELAHARCAALGTEIGALALARLGTPDAYSVDLVMGLFDAQLESIRCAALEWLTLDCPAWNDPALWTQLTEAPYDHVRLHLVELLDERARTPGVDADRASALWTAVLLGVHRGGRQKLRATRQLCDEILRKPERLDALLPVLAIAVRSSRGPERRAGLAAVVRLVTARPEFEAAVSALLPELGLAPSEAVA